MTSRCPICGAHGRRAHHPTGRGPDGRYLDPELRLPYCHDHHELAHDDWRTLFIEDRELGQEPNRPLAFIERVELRLRRLAATVARLAEAYPQYQWLAALAGALKGWADELARDIAARDRRDEGWRSDPSLYPTDG
jgi:hypothetical protein